jgi:4'-phosphopantetheinyl transferase
MRRVWVMAETELWLVDLDKAAAALDVIEAATPRLSDDTRRRLGEMGDEAARRERRLSHIALRILLERRLGPDIRRTPFVRGASGKPSLEGRDICFSLAHTKGLALIALGGGPLGVDIERIRSVRVAEARRAPIEREAVDMAGAPLKGADGDGRFLNAWVRIEAAAKAQGSGVGPILERLRRDPGEPEGCAPRPVAVTGRLVVHDLPMDDGIYAAVALAAGQEPPPLRALPHTAAAIDALLAGE